MQTVGANQTVRAGALDLTFGQRDSRAAGGRDSSTLRLWPTSDRQADEQYSSRSDNEQRDIRNRWPVNGTMFATFQLTDVSPGGQDSESDDDFAPEGGSTAGVHVCDGERVVVPSPPSIGSDYERAVRTDDRYQAMFRANKALVIPNQRGAGNRSYLLEVQEDRNEEYQQTIDLQVKGNQPPNSQSDPCASDTWCVVLDSQPFVAAKVGYLPLVSQDPATPIAYWSSRPAAGSNWRLQLPPDANPMCLVLPPQGIGETMLTNTELDNTAAAAFHFTPNAVAKLNPSLQETGYAVAPWNLRNIFGWNSIGAAVQRLDFELLYGLSCSADRPLVRLAELAATIGRVPARVASQMPWYRFATSEEREAYFRRAVYWAFVYRSYLHRVALFEGMELFGGRPGSSGQLLKDPALTCSFRLSPDSHMKGLTLPDVSQNGTLEGGATKGFVSRNVYRASVYDLTSPSGRLQPAVSSSAQTDGLKLTSLGGYAHQSAGFQKDLTKIYADISLGRTYRYRVERMGRIAVHWNLAKHVVEFERTVTPARQFATTQNRLNGWPVLRKIEEYVEILDPESKPDAGTRGETASNEQRKKWEMLRGPVGSLCFGAQVKFPVSSDWGADIGDTGWKIPLYSANAYPSDVYPRPKVFIKTKGLDRAGGATFQQEFRYPEQLFFYTQTAVRTPNGLTDPGANPLSWDPVPDVDYPASPEPLPPSGDFSGNDMRQYSGVDSPAPAMAGRTTFHLLPGADATDILLARSEKAMSAQLETLTLSRALPKPVGWEALDRVPVLQALRALEARIVDEFKKLLKEFPRRGFRLQICRDGWGR